MKIAFLSTFYPYRGGIAQFNASLFEALKGQENNIKAYTFTRQYPDFLFPGKTQYVTEDDIATKIDAKRVLDTMNPLSYIKVANEIKKFSPDVLLMRYWLSYLAPSLGYIAGKLNKTSKIIAIIDNAIPHEQKFFDNTLTKYFLKRNTGFVVMSDAVRHDVMQLRPNAKCLLLPHPLYNHFGTLLPKATAAKQLGLNPNKKTLLFFGLIRNYKGLDLLIDAFGKLPADYQLLIAGESYGSFDKYLSQIDLLPNKEDIHVFNKYINDAEVPAFFSAADVCILPYRSATQSGITSISYHFDLPIIATNVGGIHEIVKDGQTGIIVSPDSAEIEAGIREFFSGYNIARFRENIIKLKVELSWEKFAKEIVKFANSQPLSK